MQNKSETHGNVEDVAKPTSEAPLAATTGYAALTDDLHIIAQKIESVRKSLQADRREGARRIDEMLWRARCAIEDVACECAA